jgi:hypothetical protein
MIWLIGEIWPWLLASAAAGAGLTALRSTRRVPTQRWVPQPVALTADPPDPRRLPQPEPAEDRPTGSADELIAKFPHSAPVDVRREPMRAVDDFPYARPVEAERGVELRDLRRGRPDSTA